MDHRGDLKCTGRDEVDHHPFRMGLGDDVSGWIRRHERVKTLVKGTRELLRNERAEAFATEALDFVDIHRGREIPPWRFRRWVGGGDFTAIGEEFLGFCISLGGLTPQDRVLDIGSGCGRMAVPMTRYLNAQGAYEGIDVWEPGIRWCQRAITGSHPNFRFRIADLQNSHYNNSGTEEAAAFRFPYPDASFDFVLLTSVFTHLITAEVRNYVGEIARLLKDGGTCLSTWFLLGLDDGALADRQFVPYDDGCQVVSSDNPAGTVAYEHADMRTMLEEVGLGAVEIHPGLWHGLDKGMTLQDVVIARAGRPELSER
jgi:SAM-dependent methyltransferase